MKKELSKCCGGEKEYCCWRCEFMNKKRCSSCRQPFEPVVENCCEKCHRNQFGGGYSCIDSKCPCHTPKPDNKEKIKKGAIDFANRFTGVMKEMAEEESEEVEVCKHGISNCKDCSANKERDWGEMFDKEFKLSNGDWHLAGQSERIIDFISNLLLSERQRMVEIVESRLVEGEITTDRQYGNNSAVNSILSALKE